MKSKKSGITEMDKGKNRNLVDIIPIAIYECDIKGQIISANPAFSKLSGYSQDELNGMKIFDLMEISFQKESFPIDVEKLLKDKIEPEPYVTRNKTKDGRLIDVEVHWNYRYDDEGQIIGFVCTMSDITDRKLAEDALFESENKLSQIVHYSSIPTFVIDIDHTITCMNKACENLLEISLKKIIGSATDSISSIFYEIKRPIMADLIVDRASERKIAKYYSNRSKKSKLVSGAYEAEDFFPKLGENGKWLYFTSAPIKDENGNVTGAIESVQDITERKLAEVKLHDREHKLRALINAPTETAILVDKTGKILAINQIGAQRLGKSEEEFTGMDMWEYLPPDLAQSRKAMCDKAISSRKPVRFQDKRDGMYFDNNIYPVFDDKGKVTAIAIYASDITKSKQNEENLRVKDYIIESATSVIATSDLEGIMTYVNPSFLETWGFNNGEDVLGKPFSEFWMVSDILDEIMNSLQSEGSWSGELKARKKDGSLFDVQVSASMVHDKKNNPIGMMLSSIDITEKKKAEETVQERQEVINSLVETSKDWIWSIDLQGNHTYCNPAVKSILGYLAEDMIGQNSFRFMHDDDRKLIEAKLPEWIENKCGWSNQPIRWRHKNGSWRYLESNAVPILDANNNLIGFRGVDRDITKRKQAEEELRRYEHIVSSSSDMMALLNDEFEYLSANDAYLTTFQKTREELIGYKVADIFGEEFFNTTIKPNVEICLSGEEVSYQTWVESPTHGRRFMEVTYYPYFGTENKVVGFVVNGRDITERKYAEQSLLESEEKYRVLVERANDGIIIIQKGIVKFSNTRVAGMFGYSMDEMIDTSFLDYVYPDDRPRILDIYTKRLQGKDVPNIYDMRVIDKEGKEINIETNSSITTYDGEPAVLAFIRDITERKQAEEELFSEKNRITNILKGTNAGTWDWNVQTGEVTFNERWAEIIGCTLEELAPIDINTWINNVHPDDLPGAKAMLDKHFNKELDYYDVEFRQPHKDGSWVWVNARGKVVEWTEDGKPQRMSGTHLDITERKRAEEALAEQRRRLTDILEGTNVGTWEWNIQTGEATFNERWAEIIGYTLEEIQPVSISIWAKYAHPDDIKVSEKLLEKHFKGKLDYYECEVRMRHNNGDWVWVLDRGKVTTWTEDGKPLLMSGTHQDITETRRLQELESRAERLETAGRIAGQVAHDFNNLLGPLVAYPALAREELSEGHKVISYLDAMEKSAQKIADINKQLLTLGRRGHYVQEPLNLNDIVTDAINQNSGITKDIKVETMLADDIMNVKGGGAQIHRVILNLISNSIDAMPDGGQLIIKTENYYAEESLTSQKPIPKGEFVKLTIQDTGGGIPENIINKIYDPFFTTKKTDKRRGSGLGLSIVHSVMADHKGVIDCESEEGIGTIFYLYFPITRKDIEKIKNRQITGGKESILVIDDDPIQRRVSSKLLTKLGYKISTVDSGEEAIEYLKEHPQNLIILDMIMPPGIDGAETYKRVLEIYPNQKAIIVSGYANTDRIQMAMKLGATQFVQKPLTLETIAVAVRDVFSELKPVKT